MKPKISKRWPYRSVENFFDSWSPQMAYVLGYFASDGTMYKNKRGSCYIAFTSIDRELIESIKKIMRVSNKVEYYKAKVVRWNPRYTLQIGSKKVFNRLLSLGFTPNKSLTLKYPPIPNQMLGHFLRGYFDGDGCAEFASYKRKNRPSLQKVFNIRIRSGSEIFIKTLQSKLTQVIPVREGGLYFHSNAYELVYRTKDVVKLYRFMYPNPKLPCLRRKWRILNQGIKLMGP